MKIINDYLQESFNPPTLGSVTHYLFDFDHVIAVYNKYSAQPEYRSMIINILKKRKKEKKDFIKSAKELGYSFDQVKKLLHELAIHMKVNKKILNLIKEIKKKTDYKVVIATNNAPVVINYFLAFLGIDHLFDVKFHPEYANWIWKPDKKYFTKLQSLLKVPFNEMWFIDDDPNNINAFKQLGGNVTWYRKMKNE